VVDAWTDLEHGVQAALETYANVHRGSGHHSIVSTHLFEHARTVVLEHLGLDPTTHVVVFCTPRRATALTALLPAGRFRLVSSAAIGLPLGARALAVERKTLPRGIPFETGGGTARLLSPNWVIWADAPDRFEAGTPAIIPAIALAKALPLLRQHGPDAFREPGGPRSTAQDILRHDTLEEYAGRELLTRLRETLVGRGYQVPTASGLRSYVNLDNGASTPTFAPIWDAVRAAWRQPRPVQQAIVREVRAICADFLGAPAPEYEVVFTSNTTEALNIAASSLHNEIRAEGGPALEPVVLNTFLEHNSNELPWRTGGRFTLLRLSVDAEGFVDLGELETLLEAHNGTQQHGSRRIRLVTVSGASNVIGTYNDLAAICRLAHRHGARVLVDAAQLVAHRTIDMQACGIDYLALSGHKAYAPFGTGALVSRTGLLHFDTDERERIQDSGEENVAGIAALGKALVLLERIGLDVVQAEEQELTRRVLLGLAEIPGVTVYGIKDPASPQFLRRGGVIAFELRGMMPGRVARALSERGGIGARHGCHCAHLLVKRLHGVPGWAEQVQGLLVRWRPGFPLPGLMRVSLGLPNDEADVEHLLQTMRSLAATGRGRRARTSAGRPGHVADKVVRHRLEECATTAARRVFANPVHESEAL